MKETKPKSLVSRLVEPEMIIALAAVVISVCAFVVSALEVRIMREQQRAAVWPRIDIGNGFNGKKLDIGVANNGIGPAIIEAVEITVDGEPMKSWHEVLSALIGEPFTGPTFTSTMHDVVIRPGDGITALSVSSPTPVETFHRELKRLGIRLCYRNVYGDCWLVSVKFGDGKDYRGKISECPIVKSRRFYE